jgi:hypothetical protein
MAPALDLRVVGIPERVTDADLGRYYTAVARDPCAYCGQPSDEADHIDPASRGGSNGWQNLTASCSSCNRSKRTALLIPFLLRREFDYELARITQQRDALNAIGPASIGKQQSKKAAGIRRARSRAWGTPPDAPTPDIARGPTARSVKSETPGQGLI